MFSYFELLQFYSKWPICLGVNQIIAQLSRTTDMKIELSNLHLNVTRTKSTSISFRINKCLSNWVGKNTTRTISWVNFVNALCYNFVNCSLIIVVVRPTDAADDNLCTNRNYSNIRIISLNKITRLLIITTNYIINNNRVARKRMWTFLDQIEQV
jgi:hypothetical protein